MKNALTEHIENMVDFYESGIKRHSKKLGVELEWTLVHDDLSQVKYDEEHGQKWIMKELTESFPDEILDEDNNLIGVCNTRDSITLEPAGQFELSAGPFNTLAEVEDAFSKFFKSVNEIVNPHNIKMVAVGYHPKCKAEELEIIPKVRYQLMNDYFLSNSPLGIRMMRGTGSTQVSIDYSSEADCVRKLRLAYLCSPIFALLTDNTPTFEGKDRTHYLMRTEVWDDCDKKRCGVIPGLMNDSFGFEAYAAHVLNTQAMFEMDGSTGHLTSKTTSEVYGEKLMDGQACAHASSHLFNDVRLKNFIEIRPADALPTEMAIAYVALIKGLFYSEKSLENMESLFGEQNELAIEKAKKELEAKGFKAKIYGKQASEVSEKLMKIAEEGLSPNEKDYLEPIKKIVVAQETLADIACPL